MSQLPRIPLPEHLTISVTLPKPPNSHTGNGQTPIHIICVIGVPSPIPFQFRHFWRQRRSCLSQIASSVLGFRKKALVAAQWMIFIVRLRELFWWRHVWVEKSVTNWKSALEMAIFDRFSIKTNAIAATEHLNISQSTIQMPTSLVYCLTRPFRPAMV